MIADTCCRVADTLYICIHEYRKLSTKYITHESTTRCCHLRPRHRLAALSALACYFIVLSARGHDCGDRNVRRPCWETGEFILLQTQVDTTQRGDLDTINESKRNVLLQYKVRQPKTYFSQYSIW